jgi:hypothetical protein
VSDKALKSHKYNMAKLGDNYYQYKSSKAWYDDQNINRSRQFFCTHMNKNNKFFQKHILNMKVGPGTDFKDKKAKADKIFRDMMGYARVRSELKGQIYKIIYSMIDRQPKFDFNYYLSKNCPLPEDWKALREKYLGEEPKHDPLLKKQYYQELFTFESSNAEVANFLSSFFNYVLPHDFVHGKNKKIFNKKLYQYVSFNKFETFNRISMLERFKVGDFKWMEYHAKDKNSKYFWNENEFVLWRVLKWLFENLITGLIRCYFYCTEKQKEYSRLFYYRKPVWSVVMRYSVEDLIK